MKRNRMHDINLHEEKLCATLQICVSVLPGSLLFPGANQVLSINLNIGGEL